MSESPDIEAFQRILQVLLGEAVVEFSRSLELSAEVLCTPEPKKLGDTLSIPIPSEPLACVLDTRRWQAFTLTDKEMREVGGGVYPEPARLAARTMAAWVSAEAAGFRYVCFAHGLPESRTEGDSIRVAAISGEGEPLRAGVAISLEVQMVDNRHEYCYEALFGFTNG